MVGESMFRSKPGKPSKSRVERVKALHACATLANPYDGINRVRFGGY